MRFDSPEEFYKTLGFLAKSDGSISLHWEQNEKQGAWGSEGRIHCYFNLHKFPSPLRKKFTKGRKGVQRRINCNDFVFGIISTHSFQLGKKQNTDAIRVTIPAQYLQNFDEGLNL